MITRIARTLTLSLAFFLCAGLAVAQTTASATKEDEFKKKGPETKLTEVIPTDSLGEGDLMKRATSWISREESTYIKTGGTTSGTKAECIASFPIKPKELNPQVDYTGKINMKVMIEVKNSRYRYTVYDIRHESKSGRTTAGSIDNEVPECGSVAMTDYIWKKVKAQALHNAAKVVADLKEGMSEDPVEVNDDEW